MDYLGYQIIADLHDCDAELLKNVDYVQEAMLEAARQAQATIVSHTFHQFSPYGVSGAVIISESHLAIHTWPEHRFAAIDLFTCGEVIDAKIALTVLRDAFKAGHLSVTEMRRGFTT